MTQDEELLVIRSQLNRILTACSARDFVWTTAEINLYAELCEREAELLAA